MILPTLISSTSLVTLFFASKALAGVYVTNPVNETVLQAGQNINIQWVDDGVYPLLHAIGPSSISLYTGSALQQTFLARIAEDIDVSKSSQINWNVDGNVGPSGKHYFIRFQSMNQSSQEDPSKPYLGFSARFTLENMKGSFNETVSSQLAQPQGTSSSSTSPAKSSSGTTASSMNGAGTSMTDSSKASSVTTPHSSQVLSTLQSTSLSKTSSARPTTTSSTALLSEPSNAASPRSAPLRWMHTLPNGHRELSHAGIGAVVVGCMSLGLALCL